VVDEASAGSPNGKERECNETNNELTKPVNAGADLADLRIEILVDPGSCPNPIVNTTIFNDGSAPASNITVRYYAGDPNQGGATLHTAVVPGPIPKGGSVTVAVSIPMFPQTLPILIYAVVDPDNAIEECNDGNNKDAADDKIICGE
jgi:hypothetical protein